MVTVARFGVGLGNYFRVSMGSKSDTSVSLYSGDSFGISREIQAYT